tara:strand:- start:115 stop:573 length:459 start_codon:yes stop_codon:yes gene_type:complete
MSVKAYFVRINSKQEQNALAKLLETLKCPGDAPNNGWFNFCVKTTKNIPDPEGRKAVKGRTVRFGYKKNDLVAAISADNPYLFDWFLKALEDKRGNVDLLEIPYFTMLEDHPRQDHRERGSKADHFEAISEESYNTAINSQALKKMIGLAHG